MEYSLTEKGHSHLAELEDKAYEASNTMTFQSWNHLDLLTAINSSYRTVNEIKDQTSFDTRTLMNTLDDLKGRNYIKSE